MRISVIALLLTTIIFTGYGQEMSSVEYGKLIDTHRKEYQKALALDDLSPIEGKKDIKNMQYFDVDQTWKIKCLFIRTYDAKPFEMATLNGEKKPFIKYGELLFEVDGKGTQRINVYQSLKTLKIPAFKDVLFVPFKDLTNGETTFNGGRYIDLKINDTQQGIVYLDFNKAYNPWCAYGDGFSCPVPPAENTLNFKVTAGEKIYAGEETDIASE